MYLTYGIRTHIAFVVGQLNKHNADPKKSHLQAAKRIVWYLRGTIEMWLIYGQELSNKKPRNPLPYDLIGFVDRNFARDFRDCKSIKNYYFFLNRAVVSWCSKKQRIVSTSIIKAE